MSDNFRGAARSGGVILIVLLSKRLEEEGSAESTHEKSPRHVPA